MEPMHSVVTILPCTDSVVLSNISRITFYEAYTGLEPDDQMEQHLATRYTPTEIAAELYNGSAEYYIVCEQDEQNPIGYFKLTFNNPLNYTRLPSPNSVELERIYCRATHTGKGIGQQMLLHAEKIATHRQYQYIYLTVWVKNERAIRFYEKNGFVKSGLVPYNFAGVLEDDWLMVKNLGGYT